MGVGVGAGKGGMKGASPAFACLCLKLTSQQAASGVAPGILMPSFLSFSCLPRPLSLSVRLLTLLMA